MKEIIEGRKRYEFRKRIFKDGEVKKIYVYSSSPVKKIVGYFRIGKIIKDKPELLWNKFKQYSGINQEEFFEYFKDKDDGFAIEISQFVQFFNQLDPYLFFEEFVPPQSYMYCDNVQTVQ